MSAVTSNGVLVVIPARYASRRFPGKPLADLCGKPMIQHVWERAMAAKRPGRVIVATDEERIAKVVRAFGGVCAITSTSHRTGTERVAEVAAAYADPLVVNLQGDLPLFSPATLDRLIDAALGAGQAADVVTARARIEREEDVHSTSSVKVVVDRQGRALYFSRLPIPYQMSGERPPVPHYQHYGIYLFRRDFLCRLVQEKEGELEGAEQLEQLRVLEAGGTILTLELTSDEIPFLCEVNHPEDLARAAKVLMRQHPTA